MLNCEWESQAFDFHSVNVQFHFEVNFVTVGNANTAALVH